jgi:hypothetical protein
VKSPLAIDGPVVGENSLPAFTVSELLPVVTVVRSSYRTVTDPVKSAKIVPVCVRKTLDCTTEIFPMAPRLALTVWVVEAVAADAAGTSAPNKSN